MEERLDAITDLLRAVSDRLTIVEGKVKGEGKTVKKSDDTEKVTTVSDTVHNNQPAGQAIGDSPNSVDYIVPAVAAAADIQKEFESVRDSVAKITLPPWLKVHDSQAGIKQENKQALKILSKSARYTETGLKLLSSFHKDEDTNTFVLTEEDIGALYTTLSAESYYLQSEYSNIVVKSSFDDETSKIFQSLENNTAAFSGQALQNVRIAAELAAISGRTQTRYNRGSSSGLPHTGGRFPPRNRYFSGFTRTSGFPRRPYRGDGGFRDGFRE